MLRQAGSEDDEVWTWRHIAERAARVEHDRAARVRAAVGPGGAHGHRYQHVVDEAQDLNPAYWKMLSRQSITARLSWITTLT